MNDADNELPGLLATDLDSAFRQLVLRYQDALYAFALRLTGSAQEAEDVVQEAFAGAYLTLRHYPAGRIQTLKLKAWLYKLTLNVFRNSRRGTRLLLLPLEQPEGTRGRDQSRPYEIPDAEAERPDAIFAEAERRQELAALVNSLPEHYRLVITCYYFEELTYPEIADLLDQPLGTIKSRLHRAVQMLRQRMQQEQEQQQERSSTYGAS